MPEIYQHHALPTVAELELRELWRTLDTATRRISELQRRVGGAVADPQASGGTAGQAVGLGGGAFVTLLALAEPVLLTNS